MADVEQLKKLVIKSEKGDQVSALFNPKEMGIDKSVPWQQQKDAKGDAPPVEFTTGAPKTMSFELLFDLFEDKGDVYAKFVSQLEKMVKIDPGLKRPPMVTVAWSNNFPAFKGVMESMNVKYTMFLPDGTPCRCTANVKVKEAQSAQVKSSGKKKSNHRKDAESKGSDTVPSGGSGSSGSGG